MTRWTEVGLVALLLLAAQDQALSVPAQSAAQDQAPPVELRASSGDRRAVLLEAGDFFEQPSSSGDVVARFEAGEVFTYIGEAEDDFGRVWYEIRHPGKSRRRNDVYLVPFDRSAFRDLGFRGALLANRVSIQAPPGPAARAAATAPAASQAPWWTPVGMVTAGNPMTYGEVVGISGTAPAEHEVRDAIDLLGGIDALAFWPADPLPGQLFVPPLLPAVFRFDGEGWDLAQPVRLLADGLSILGNSEFVIDRAAPPMMGGPEIYCWSLVGAQDPRGQVSGSVAAAPPPAPPSRGQPVPEDFGPFDVSRAPAWARDVLPPAPATTRVPARVDPPPAQGGVLLSDSDGKQAVFMQQRLGPALTEHLLGESMVVDLVARNSPTGDAATFGIDVEIQYGDGRRPTHKSGAFTASGRSYRYEWAFEVPPDAADIIIRALPLDRSLAVEQRAAVVFERVGLRRAGWDPAPPAAAFLLHRVTVGSFAGDSLFTRAPVGVTTGSMQQARQAWEQVQGANWPTEINQLVLAGEVDHGMSEAQTRAAWGSPAEQVPLPSGSGVKWTWSADDRTATFADGVLILFSQPSPGLLEKPEIRCLEQVSR